MKKITCFFVAFLIVIFSISCDKEIPTQDVSNNTVTNSKIEAAQYTYDGPGVVIAHEEYSPLDQSGTPSRRIFVSGPSICKLPNGNLVAGYDLGGPDSGASTSATTKMFKSNDGGASWFPLATLTDLMSANLFVHNDALYALGVTKSSGDVNGRAKIVIRKSLDNGVTWTTATSSTTGIIKYDTFNGNNTTANHTAPTPIVIHNGKIWRAMENVNGGGPWPEYFQSFMISAPINSDLLNSNSWTKSNYVKAIDFPNTSIGSRFKGWLEGNAVLGPNNTMINVLRVHQDQTTTESKNSEYAALVDVSSDGRTQSFDPTNLVSFPGGSKKFTIRYDAQSAKYWTISNYVPNEYLNIKELNNVRNTLALCYSTDLKTWDVGSIVLQNTDYTKVAYQYADWQFDGSDIVMVSRTAYENGDIRDSNPHNANFLTFHRISNFRENLDQTLGIKSW